MNSFEKYSESLKPHINAMSFMLVKSLITVLICGGFLLVKGVKIRLSKPPKSIFASVNYAVMNGLGNLLILVALVHVNASVQYPMITGGTIVVSTIISIICKERITRKNIASSALALPATLLIV